MAKVSKGKNRSATPQPVCSDTIAYRGQPFTWANNTSPLRTLVVKPTGAWPTGVPNPAYLPSPTNTFTPAATAVPQPYEYSVTYENSVGSPCGSETNPKLIINQ